MLPLMFVVAFLGVAPASSGIQWAQCALLMIWFFCYGKSAIASEKSQLIHQDAQSGPSRMQSQQKSERAISG